MSVDVSIANSLATPRGGLAEAPSRRVANVRLFVQVPLGVGGSITLAAAQAHYLLTVMRRRAGDIVGLFNGADGEFTARIESSGPGACGLRILERVRAQDQEADLWLCFALLKRQSTDFLVQKATELGVSCLLPITTARSMAERVNCGRLHAIATEAAEQSERLTVPTIREPQKLSSCLADWNPARRLIACVERSADARLTPGFSGPTALLVGPEGGFSDDELGLLRALPFVDAVSLGPRVMRAETAAIAGLAIVQAH